MKYKKPKMEIHEFEEEDIVRTSGGGAYHNPDNPGDDLSDLDGENW